MLPHTTAVVGSSLYLSSFVPITMNKGWNDEQYIYFVKDFPCLDLTNILVSHHSMSNQSLTYVAGFFRFKHWLRPVSVDWCLCRILCYPRIKSHFQYEEYILWLWRHWLLQGGDILSRVSTVVLTMNLYQLNDKSFWLGPIIKNGVWKTKTFPVRKWSLVTWIWIPK